MPDLKVEYFAQLRSAVGGLCEEIVALDRETKVQELISHLAKKHGPEFASIVIDKRGAVRPSILCFADGTQVSHTAELVPNQVGTLLLMSPVGGG